MRRKNRVASLLWRYFKLYWLKPFDAVNDTATASMLLSFDWSGQFAETGSGDGVYSFIMHSGDFPLSFDRYWLADLGQKKDIYDSHQKGFLSISRRADQNLDITISIDRKYTHLQKVKEIGFFKLPVQCRAEYLPIKSDYLDMLFCYVFHGMDDHDAALVEAARIVKKGGRILVLVYNESVSKNFLCYKIYQWAAAKKHKRIANYFKSLDNGRHNEVTKMSRSLKEWQLTFKNLDLQIEKVYEAVSPFAWKVYDTQTRPFLKIMIRVLNILFVLRLRTAFKLLYMTAVFPFIFVFYKLFAAPKEIDTTHIDTASKGCLLAFQLVKLPQ